MTKNSSNFAGSCPLITFPIVWLIVHGCVGKQKCLLCSKLSQTCCQNTRKFRSLSAFVEHLISPYKDDRPISAVDWYCLMFHYILIVCFVRNIFRSVRRMFISIVKTVKLLNTPFAQCFSTTLFVFLFLEVFCSPVFPKKCCLMFTFV